MARVWSSPAKSDMTIAGARDHAPESAVLPPV
jgi:hypothetical protein